jgi:hypothetical protein
MVSLKHIEAYQSRTESITEPDPQLSSRHTMAFQIVRTRK